MPFLLTLFALGGFPLARFSPVFSRGFFRPLLPPLPTNPARFTSSAFSPLGLRPARRAINLLTKLYGYIIIKNEFVCLLRPPA